AVDARAILAGAAAAVGGGGAALAAPRARRARPADAAPPGAARVDAVAARAALLVAGDEATLRRAADLEDQVGAARLPGDAGVVAQGDVVAEPEPAAARGAVVRPLLAQPAPDAEVHAVARDGRRHLERAGGRGPGPREDRRLRRAGGARVDRARVAGRIGAC